MLNKDQIDFLNTLIENDGGCTFEMCARFDIACQVDDDMDEVNDFYHSARGKNRCPLDEPENGCVVFTNAARRAKELLFFNTVEEVLDKP